MARNETGVMVRLRPETRDRIARAIARLMVAAADGLMAAWWEGDELTVDQYIRRLLDREEGKAKRARKAKRAAKKRRRAELLDDMFGPNRPWHAPGTVYAALPTHRPAEQQEGRNGN